MKEFAVYTALRLLMFAAAFAVVAGIWLAVSDSVPVVWVVLIALLISGVVSYFVLNRPRDAFARRVDERAKRAAAAFEAQRAREDTD